MGAMQTLAIRGFQKLLPLHAFHARHRIVSAEESGRIDH